MFTRVSSCGACSLSSDQGLVLGVFLPVRDFLTQAKEDFQKKWDAPAKVR